MIGQLIGVDVGGTKISVASMRDGTLAEPTLQPTASTDARALLEEIVSSVAAIRAADAAGVGVGVPSVVEFSTGRAKSSVNLKLADVSLRAALRERLGLPVFVDNDANCAALAEAYEGSEIIVQNLVMITVGTGVGGGLVLGGRLYRGATGAAGELGHTLIGAHLEQGAPVARAFPQEGSLESLTSGRTLDALAEADARRHPRSALGSLLATGVAVRGPDVVVAAQAGDDRACALLELLGQRLGIGIANAINTFDPELVVIGGGVASAGELVLGPARKSARRFMLPGVGERTEIRLARHGVEAGVRGAALLAGHELAIAGEDAISGGAQAPRSPEA
jgi:glucokinase